MFLRHTHESLCTLNFSPYCQLRRLLFSGKLQRNNYLFFSTMSSAIPLLNDKIDNLMQHWSLATRPFAGPGLWLPLLLPTAIILSDFKIPAASEQYHLTSVLCGTLLSSFVMFLFIHLFSSADNTYHLSVCSAAILTAFTSLRLHFFNERGIAFSILSSCSASFGFGYGTVALMKACPRCFSFGEACLVMQAIIIFILTSACNIYTSWFITPTTDLAIATLILQVGLLGITIICFIMYFIPDARSVVCFYAVVFGVLFSGVIPVLHILLNASPVLWILKLLVINIQSVSILAYWVGCCSVAVAAIAHQINAERKASTVVRKYFHILAVAVYIPGLIYTCCLLYLASGIILAIFVIFEIIRILKIPPLVLVLQEGFMVYVDEKDAGNLALTPIYLLAGCSMPIWIYPLGCVSIDFFLPLLSGLLSIGVGDTCASTVGLYLGHHKWKGSQKSVEGTIGCIAGQIISFALLISLGFLDYGSHDVLKILGAVICTSLVEAMTDQVDNLVLPLIAYILLV